MPTNKFSDLTTEQLCDLYEKGEALGISTEQAIAITPLIKARKKAGTWRKGAAPAKKSENRGVAAKAKE